METKHEDGLAWRLLLAETAAREAGKRLAGKRGYDAEALKAVTALATLRARIEVEDAEGGESETMKELEALWEKNWAALCVRMKWAGKKQPARRRSHKGARPNRGIVEAAKILDVPHRSLRAVLRGEAPNDHVMSAVTGIPLGEVRRIRIEGIRL